MVGFLTVLDILGVVGLAASHLDGVEEPPSCVLIDPGLTDWPMPFL
jgi:hypothetical protein